MVIPSLHKLLSDDLAIDLGTVNTLVYARGRGIVVSGPSLVAVKRDTGDVVAVGMEALEMMGRSPRDITLIRPLREGVVADAELAGKMLEQFIRRARGGFSRISKHIILGIPPRLTDIECRAVRAAANEAGASRVYLISQGLAAALGAGLPVTEPNAVMIVDIGGALTSITVIAGARAVLAESAPVGGSLMDAAIVDYFKREHGLIVGERSAERVKMELGSALPPEEGRTTQIIGQSVIRDAPEMVTISAEEVYEVIYPIVEGIVEAVKRSFEGVPPDAAADIYIRGITLTGGGSLLTGLTQLLAKETGLKIKIAENPLHSVALGAGKLFDNPLLLRRVVRESGCAV